jgi:hypothetical protein
MGMDATPRVPLLESTDVHDDHRRSCAWRFRLGLGPPPPMQESRPAGYRGDARH